MTPVQVLADTLQVDPTRIEAALKGHGLTIVRNQPLARLLTHTHGNVRVDFSDGPHRYPMCDQCGQELGVYVEDWESIG